MTEQNELEQYAYFVSIEWNGQKPPTAWYTRINDMGFVIRGQGDGENKGTILTDRIRAGSKLARKKEPLGVAFQEGYYLCKTRDTAKMLMRWAKLYGAAIALTGRYVPEDFFLTDQDLKSLDQIVNSTSKRGPKRIADKGMYVVTCADEVKTFEIESEGVPFTCPMCNSYHIIARQGKKSAFQLPKDLASYDQDQLFQFWKDTRFGNPNGTFEIPKLALAGNGEKILPKAPKCREDVKLPVLSEPMPDQVKNFKGLPKLHLYDLMWTVGAVSQSETARISNRLRVLEAYAMSGGNKPYMMAAPADGLDIIDLCFYDNSLTKYL